MIGPCYTHCPYDNYVYFWQFGRFFVYWLSCIDDMFIAFKYESLINRLKPQRSDEFEMQDFGTTQIFDLKILTDHEACKLDQCQRK